MDVIKSKQSPKKYDIFQKATIELNVCKSGFIYLASHSNSKAKSASERPTATDLRSQTDHRLGH